MGWEFWLVVGAILHFGIGMLVARWMGIREGDELDWIFIWVWEFVVLGLYGVGFWKEVGARILFWRARRALDKYDKSLDRLQDKLDKSKRLLDEVVAPFGKKEEEGK